MQYVKKQEIYDAVQWDGTIGSAETFLRHIRDFNNTSDDLAYIIPMYGRLYIKFPKIEIVSGTHDMEIKLKCNFTIKPEDDYYAMKGQLWESRTFLHFFEELKQKGDNNGV